MRDLGLVRGLRVRCSDLVLVQAVGDAQATAASLFPSRARIPLRAVRGGPPVASLLTDATSASLSLVETDGVWRRVRASGPSGFALEGWVHASDLSTRAPELSEPLLFVGDLAGGFGMCGSSDPPPSSYVVLRRGAPLYRTQDARPFARATSDRTFVVWDTGDGWLTIVRAPELSIPCAPLALVHADDVLERRAGP